MSYFARQKRHSINFGFCPIFCDPPNMYKSKNMNFSLYVCKRMRYLMDQYLILKSKNFLGSDELKKSLSPLEKGVEDFYKNALFSQESM